MSIDVKGSGIMLIQFNFKNHKSFYEKSYLDMTATTEKRHLENTIEVNGNRLLPFLSIYGANASGKTTVIDAFYFMAKSIVTTFDSNINDPFMVAPFIFGKNTKIEPSEFEVFVNIGDYEYRYGYIATREKILEEWLSKKPYRKNTKAKEKKIFERSNNQVQFSPEFSEYESFSDFMNDSNIINSKSLVISFIGRKNIGEIGEIYNWFLNISYLSDISRSLFLKSRSIKLLHQDKFVKKEFVKLLNDIDPCLKDLDINTKEDENQRIRYEVYGIHSSIDEKDKTYKLPLEGESDGTNKVIRVVPLIIKSLMEGSLLFIDELDTQLHPLLFKKIVSMYSDKSINKKNAQLIFTTHNTYMLNRDDSRRDQVMFVEKDRSGKSKLYSLAEFKKLRCDADYEKKYFEGSFGSIPFLKK